MSKREREEGEEGGWIMGIDPAPYNHGWAVMDPATGEVVSLGREDFFPNTDVRADQAFTRVNKWLDEIEDITNKVDMVYIEKQPMNPRNIVVSHTLAIIQAVIQTRFRHRHKVVPPSDVKHKFGTSRGKHGRNKEAAIEEVKQRANLCSALERDYKGKTGKEDDVCDALLLCEYGRCTKCTLEQFERENKKAKPYPVCSTHTQTGGRLRPRQGDQCWLSVPS